MRSSISSRWRGARVDSNGLEDFNSASRVTPVIANIRPSGDKYLMEDFYYAGGLLGLMSRLKPFLDLSQINVSGRSWAHSLEAAQVYDDDVIRPLDHPIYAEGALAVLKGNLAPNGCVMKPSAAEPRLLRHSGPALVFDNYAALKASIDRDDLDVTPDHVLVLRNAGPLGAPGMPEWGALPIPKKLLKQGVRDMVRISDARMSGTAYGACILHVSPESYIGGTLAVVQTGDVITLDVPARTLHLDVPEAELARRRDRSPRSRAALWAGVRLDVLATRETSRPGLRLRLPGNGFRRARAGAGDLLMLPAADAPTPAFEGRFDRGARVGRRRPRLQLFEPESPPCPSSSTVKKSIRSCPRSAVRSRSSGCAPSIRISARSKS